MNPKQLQIIETFGLGQSVIAGAGCGKTTTLVAKCLELLKLHPQARFCAVSFTEKSVRDLREALTKGLGLERKLDASHWVKTIHGLCYTILQEFPVAAGLQGGEKILLEDEANRLWDRSIEVLWTSTDNAEISLAVENLLQVYNRDQLESLFKKLRSLMSFGVEKKIPPEMAAIWLVFQSVYLRYQHAKNRDGGLDFNDLELLALKALQDDTVAAYYQKRFDLVLVDEFQDTNPLQAAILERFVKPKFTNLCIVGDPKQSIYRFRDADVSVFQDLSERLPSKHLLDTNYRSRPRIIEFVNDVCAPTFAESHLPYEALEAGREEDAPNTARVSRLEIESETELATFLKSEANRGVDLSEYVILARSVRKEKILKYLRALDHVEVPFLLGSGGRFYADPRVIEIVAFLRGWISPKNTLSQVAALRAPWIQVTDPKLFEWSKTQEISYFERFFAESLHPLAQKLKPFFQNKNRATYFRPGQILEVALSVDALDDELYLPLVSLWHKSEKLSTQGQRFEDIVQYFSSAIESEKIEKDIPAPAESGMVRVLTIHSAKGLQFPRVILLDFDGEYKSPAALADLIWDRKKGVHLYRRDEDGKRDKEDATNIAWTALEKAAQIAESKRVFYVALTRAQEELILVWKKEVKRSKASEAPGFNPHLSDNWRAWVEASKIPELKHSELQLTSLVPIKKHESTHTHGIRAKNFDPKPFRPRHSPSEWLVLNQCEYRYHLKFSPQTLAEEEEKPLYLQAEFTDLEKGEGRDEKAQATSPNSPKVAPEKLLNDEKTVQTHSPVAEKGERIHRYLELEDFEGLQNEFSPTIREPLKAAIMHALSRSENIKIYREFGFEVPLSSKEALVGMMDRLEIDFAEKTIRVVDYKFTANPKSPEELIKTYEIQLKLYLWAATKLVGFIPTKLEAELIHFTENKLFERIPLNFSAGDLLQIDDLVKTLYNQARKRVGPPRLGDYCRYCEFVARCPAQAKT
jgi:ATP-dependent exoDNAse (exonuclease V) beta subunit